MIRNLLIITSLFAVLAAGASRADAQQWAQKMFKVKSHDFGTVARGSQPEFAFEITNVYEEPLEIAEVRTSCGCTTPRITKRRLKTWETGSIVALLNTKSFTGHKSATLTVVISKPFRAEVQLSIQGTIRSDIVLAPWQVDFQDVPLGQARERQVQISHAGRGDWRITDVRSANPHFEVELLSERRTTNLMTYDMLVRLKPGAPAGYFQDQLTLVTNDASNRSVNLTVQGRVLSPVTVSPASLFMGVIGPGQTVTKRLVVRSAEPFRILDVKCKNGAFDFRVSGEAKRLHIVPVTFAASDETGQIVETIRIETDLSGGTQADCKACITVQSNSE